MRTTFTNTEIDCITKHLSSSTQVRPVLVDRLLRPKASTKWTHLKVSGENSDPQEVVKTCFSFLHLYPRVIVELKQLLAKPDTVLAWVEQLLRGKIRYGRDVYFEKNHRFTVSEMFNVISKHYTSWRVDEGRNLMVMLAMQLVRSDLKPTGFMRENIEIEAPLPLLGVAGSTSVIDAIKHEMTLELFNMYFGLLKNVESGVGRDKPLFTKGTPMLESDIRDALLARRRPLFALLYDIGRVDSDMDTLCALLSGYYYDVRTPNWDVIGELVQSQEVINASRYINFFTLIYNDDTYLTKLCNLSLPKDEILTKIRRVTRYMTTFTYFDDVSVNDVYDETTLYVSKSLDGEVNGLLSLQYLAAKSDEIKALRTKVSDYNPFLLTVEERSFTGISTLLKNNGKFSEALLNGSYIADRLNEFVQDSLQVSGFKTNLDDDELLSCAISLLQGNIYLTEPVTEFTVSTATITSLDKKPEMCFPVVLDPTCRVKNWTIGSLSRDYYTTSVMHFLIGKLTNNKLMGHKTTTTTVAQGFYKIGKPRVLDNTFLSDFNMATDYLATFAHTKLKEIDYKFQLRVTYDNVEHEVEVRLKDVFSEYWLTDVAIYGEKFGKLARSFNYSIIKNIELGHITAVYEELQSASTTVDIDTVKRRFDNTTLDAIKELVANSPLLRRIFQYALNAVVLAITRKSGAKAKVHATMLYKHLANIVGREVLLHYCLWSNCLPLRAIVDNDDVIGRVTDLEVRSLFI